MMCTRLSWAVLLLELLRFKKKGRPKTDGQVFRLSKPAREESVPKRIQLLDYEKMVNKRLRTKPFYPNQIDQQAPVRRPSAVKLNGAPFQIP
jgi:hypothetical protein